MSITTALSGDDQEPIPTRAPRTTRGRLSRRWAFVRRYDIPDLDDPSTTYLTRWRLLECPWFGIYVHAIRRPDRDPYTHDHPWPFAVLMLRGGYWERFYRDLDEAVAAGNPQGGLRRWRAGSFRVLPTTAFHSISALERTPTWTLMVVGPRRREWGYATPGGWVHHDDYRLRAPADGGQLTLTMLATEGTRPAPTAKSM